MFRMVSAYEIENLAALAGTYKGLSLRAKLTTTSVPSAFSIKLANTEHNVGFFWNPDTIKVDMATLNTSLAVPTWSGNNNTKAIVAPYSEASIFLQVRGSGAFASVLYGGERQSVSGTFYEANPVTYEVGWRVEVTSNDVGVPCNTIMKQYAVTADGSNGGNLTIEHITLSAGDIANKYVTLLDPNPDYVALNLSEATSQRRGIDFEMAGNKVYWNGYGLDTPQLLPGMTLRVIYYSGTYGEPYIQWISKKLISFGGHGNV